MRPFSTLLTESHINISKLSKGITHHQLRYKSGSSSKLLGYFTVNIEKCITHVPA